MKMNAGNGSRVPDFVFLAHIVDITSAMHGQCCLRSFASLPFRTRFFLIPFFPLAIIALLAMWLCSKTFLFSFYYLRDRLHQTWVVPRYGFQVRVFIFLLSSLMIRIFLIVKRNFINWLIVLMITLTVFLAICYWGYQ
jgi:hypothetical protein